MLVACSGPPVPPSPERPAYARDWTLHGAPEEDPCALGWGCPNATNTPGVIATDVGVLVGPDTPVVAGAEGCGPAFVAYCDADGVTFHAPERCPDRPNATPGPCPEAGEAVTERFSPDEAADPTRPQFRSTACTSSDTCARGRRCWGIEGCTTIWTCERVRHCPRETDQWCSCDGETFTASRACPGRPVRHRGPCDQRAVSEQR